MLSQSTLFIFAFLAPIIFYRFLAWYLLSFIFTRAFTRSILKVQVHHLHYGALFCLMGAILLLIQGQTDLVIIALGLGLGLIMDLFIASLWVQTNREQELLVYRQSLWPTIIISVIIVALVLILPAIVRP